MPKTVRTLDELIDTANRETKGIQVMSPEEQRAWIAAQPFIPPNIPVGGGSFIFTTKEGLAALREFGERWRLEKPERQRLLGGDKAMDLAVQAYGELLKRAKETLYLPQIDSKAVLREDCLRNNSQRHE